MAYSRDAFIRDQQETRERQDQSWTSIGLERYGDIENGLSESNKIAGESQRESQRLERYGDIEDGLSQSNKIAGERQRLEGARENQREFERARERNLQTYRAIP